MIIRTHDRTRLTKPKVAGETRGTFFRGLYVAIVLALVFWVALGLFIWWLV